LPVHRRHPTTTVGQPTTAEAPQAQASPTRRAGRPAIITVALPAVNGLTVGWWPLGGSEQACMSPSTAAGLPAIITVATPGPVIVPPWLVVSPTQAAAGIVVSFIRPS
jgi:hypothetical protein